MDIIVSNRINPIRGGLIAGWVVLFLFSCFQTETVPGTLLQKSNIQYRIDTSSSCWMRERLFLRVPMPARFDSLRLCVRSDSNEDCKKFTGSDVEYISDTLLLEFLQDARPYSVICTTYYRGKTYPEMLALDDEGVGRYIPVPESLTFHIGDKALHYAYSIREGSYVSRDFETSGFTLSGDRSELNFFGYGLDSIVLGGRIPQPLFAAVRTSLVSQDTLQLGSEKRVIRAPGKSPFDLRFWRSDANMGCGSVRVGSGPEDTLQIAFRQGWIQIPAQSSERIELCIADTCRRL